MLPLPEKREAALVWDEREQKVCEHSRHRCVTDRSYVALHEQHLHRHGEGACGGGTRLATGDGGRLARRRRRVMLAPRPCPPVVVLLFDDADKGRGLSGDASITTTADGAVGLMETLRLGRGVRDAIFVFFP